MTRFPTPLAQQEADAEATRQEQLDIFVASLRDYAHKYDWALLLACIPGAYEKRQAGWVVEGMRAEIDAFAEGYGWPSTLRAIAQAMEADDVAKRELESRR